MSLYQAPPDKRVSQKIIFLISQHKTYGVGTQKNRLNETFLLSTQNSENTCLNWWVRK